MFAAVGCSGPAFEYVPGPTPPGSGGTPAAATTLALVKPGATGGNYSTGDSSTLAGGIAGIAPTTLAPVLDAGTGGDRPGSGGSSPGFGGASGVGGGAANTGGDPSSTGGAHSTGGTLATGGASAAPCTSAYTSGLCASSAAPVTPPGQQTKCSANPTNCPDASYPYWCVYRTCPQ